MTRAAGPRDVGIRGEAPPCSFLIGRCRERARRGPFPLLDGRARRSSRCSPLSCRPSTFEEGVVQQRYGLLGGRPRPRGLDFIQVHGRRLRRRDAIDLPFRIRELRSRGRHAARDAPPLHGLVVRALPVRRPRRRRRVPGPALLPALGFGGGSSCRPLARLRDKKARVRRGGGPPQGVVARPRHAGLRLHPLLLAECSTSRYSCAAVPGQPLARCSGRGFKADGFGFGSRSPNRQVCSPIPVRPSCGEGLRLCGIQCGIASGM